MLRTDISQFLLKQYGKQNPPALRAGDTVKVHQKIKEGDKERVQIFEGLVIAVKHGKGLDASFTVRKVSVGSVAVERVYPLHSPNIVKVERTKHADVRRAKLYYMRDRFGKRARFKSESASPMAWDEPAFVEPEVVAEEVTVEEVVTPEVTEDVVAEVAAEEVATPEVAEEAATEEVVAEAPVETPEKDGEKEEA
jgi:large subunit ribosomal protein L19